MKGLFILDLYEAVVVVAIVAIAWYLILQSSGIVNNIMIRFSQFIKEAITYKELDPQRQGGEEHDETTYQSSEIKAGNMESIHPAIAKSIHKFAKDKAGFIEALANSSIEKVQQGTEVDNTEMGQDIDTVDDKAKVQRVQGMIEKGNPIDRPIILRHRDKKGGSHYHLLAGNTRATAIGYGVEAYHIDV